MQPTADHYIGRELVGVVNLKSDFPQMIWAIELEGDVLIHNADMAWEEPTIPAAEGEVVRLTRVVVEKTITRLYFGTKDNPIRTQVWLDPINYAISDPVYGDDPVFVQRSEESVPPEPEGRAVEAPSQEWIDRQEEVAEKARVEEYERLVAGGLSDGEARATVWPADEPAEGEMVED